MRRFLVVGYDGDQQQWFYDFVFAIDADRAKGRVLQIRDQCQDADAIPLHELTRMARNLRKASKPQTERWLRDLSPNDFVHKPDCHLPRGSADCSCKP
jgi:hypothetical protein